MVSTLGFTALGSRVYRLLQIANLAGGGLACCCNWHFGPAKLEAYFWELLMHSFGFI